MDVKIIFYKGAAEKTYKNIVNIYSKDDMLVLRNLDGWLLKFPLMHVFQVCHKHNDHCGSGGYIGGVNESKNN